MQLGFSSMNTPEEVRPDELGRALEERGYDSLWIGEHTHIPTSRRTPYPAGGELPEPYLRMMDPYVGPDARRQRHHLALLVGTGVALPLEHDVLALAKTAATLDRLSGGRLLFGVGCGLEPGGAGQPHRHPLGATVPGPRGVRGGPPVPVDSG